MTLEKTYTTYLKDFNAPKTVSTKQGTNLNIGLNDPITVKNDTTGVPEPTFNVGRMAREDITSHQTQTQYRKASFDK